MSAYKPSSGVPANFHEYPKWMYAVLGTGSLIVNNAEEEAALGSDFSPQKPGSKHIEPAYAADPEPSKFQEFPKWKHSIEGQSCVVNSENEEASLGPSWFNTAKEAREASRPDPVLSSIPASPVKQDGLQLTEAEIIVVKQQREAQEKNDLVDQAVALGIRVNGAWGLPRLRKEVEAAKANGG